VLHRSNACGALAFSNVSILSSLAPILVVLRQTSLLFYLHASHGPFGVLAVVSRGIDAAYDGTGECVRRSLDCDSSRFCSIRNSPSDKSNGDEMRSLRREGVRRICRYLWCLLRYGECPCSASCCSGVDHPAGSMAIRF